MKVEGAATSETVDVDDHATVEDKFIEPFDEALVRVG